MFNLDVIYDEATRAPFEFVLGEKTWRVPHVADLELGQQMALDAMQVPFVARQVGRRVLDDGTDVADGDGLAEAVLHLRGSKVGKLLTAWMAHAGMAPGESGASSISSNGTARPSKRTSKRPTA